MFVSSLQQFDRTVKRYLSKEADRKSRHTATDIWALPWVRTYRTLFWVHQRNDGSNEISTSQERQIWLLYHIEPRGNMWRLSDMAIITVLFRSLNYIRWIYLLYEALTNIFITLQACAIVEIQPTWIHRKFIKATMNERGHWLFQN